MFEYVPKWRNWQTHGTQNPAVAIPCRFDSDLRHQKLSRCGVLVNNSTCVFCKIIQGTIPSTIISQNDHVMVIKDINPKAPVHYLIIPKKHIESVLTLSDTDAEYCWHMLKMARDIGKRLSSQAFNLIANNGAAAGQSVPHVHFHLLSGKNLYEHGLKL